MGSKARSSDIEFWNQTLSKHLGPTMYAKFKSDVSDERANIKSLRSFIKNEMIGAKDNRDPQMEYELENKFESVISDLLVHMGTSVDVYRGMIDSPKYDIIPIHLTDGGSSSVGPSENRAKSNSTRRNNLGMQIQEMILKDNSKLPYMDIFTVYSNIRTVLVEMNLWNCQFEVPDGLSICQLCLSRGGEIISSSNVFEILRILVGHCENIRELISDKSEFDKVITPFIKQHNDNKNVHYRTIGRFIDGNVDTIDRIEIMRHLVSYPFIMTQRDEYDLKISQAKQIAFHYFEEYRLYDPIHMGDAEKIFNHITANFICQNGKHLSLLSYTIPKENTCDCKALNNLLRNGYTTGTLPLNMVTTLEDFMKNMVEDCYHKYQKEIMSRDKLGTCLKGEKRKHEESYHYFNLAKALIQSIQKVDPY